MAREVTAQTSITKDELAKLQQEDTTQVKYVDLKDAARKGDYKIKYEKLRGILYSSGFQPGGRDPHGGNQAFFGGSQKLLEF